MTDEGVAISTHCTGENVDSLSLMFHLQRSVQCEKAFSSNQKQRRHVHLLKEAANMEDVSVGKHNEQLVQIVSKVCE